MLISIHALIAKIDDTVAHFQDGGPQMVVEQLQDTRNLIEAASKQFNLHEFPTCPGCCTALIDKEDNDLTEYDNEGLQYLSQSVKWTLDICEKTLS